MNHKKFLTNIDSLQLLELSNQLPSGLQHPCTFYDNLPVTCDALARHGYCDYDWLKMQKEKNCFGDGKIPDGKVKDHCQISCQLGSK